MQNIGKIFYVFIELCMKGDNCEKIVYSVIYVMEEDCLSYLTCVLSFCLFEQ